jgi:hypothetical protein
MSSELNEMDVIDSGVDVLRFQSFIDLNVGCPIDLVFNKVSATNIPSSNLKKKRATGN